MKSSSRPFRKSGLALLAALSLTAFSQNASAQKKTKIVGFYPDYSAAGVNNSQMAKLSYVIYFSIKPPSDGNVSDEYVLASINAQNMIDIVDQGKKYGTGVLLCVGGSVESAGFPALAGNATVRKKFASSLADFCVRNGLAGIDIDWEFPGSGGAANFTALAKDMRAAFTPKNLVMSTNVNASATESYQYDALMQFDWIQIMSYDNDWPPGTTPHSTYAQATSNLQNYVSIVGAANKNKVVLGVPFYGKSTAGSLGYADIVKANPGLSPTADNAGGYNFNGTSTLAQKTNYVIDQGDGGVMIWNLVQDTPDQVLLASIQKAVIDKGYIVEQAKPVVSNRTLFRAARIGEPLRNDNGFLTLPAPAQGSYSLSLSSLSGRLVKSWPAESASGISPLRWQSAGLGEGAYLYRVEGNAGRFAGRITLRK
jgi:chitinase